MVHWPDEALLGWLIFVACFLVLRLFNLLDTPFKLTMSMGGGRYPFPFSYWLTVSGAVGVLLGLCSSAYFPLKQTMCFLDLVCVHQGDAELLQRGISNIGACLAASQKLQVLYHPSYFSSLLVL